MAKTVNYTPEQVKEMLSAYDPKADQKTRDSVVLALAERFGRHIRSIRAKLVAEKVYVKAAKVSNVTDKPAMKKDAMAEKLAETMGIFLNTESVAKMNKQDIDNIQTEVERLQKEISDRDKVAEFAGFDYISEATNMAEFAEAEGIVNKVFEKDIENAESENKPVADETTE